MQFNLEDPSQCEAHVRTLLADLPERLHHTLVVGNYARQIARSISRLHPELRLDETFCYCAGCLHDIGYATGLKRTGFHPIDGAEHLREQGFERLADIVLLHSTAPEEAECLGVSCHFPPETIYSKIITFADIHVSRAGDIVTLDERFAPAFKAFGERHPIAQGLRRALPRLRQLDADIRTLGELRDP